VAFTAMLPVLFNACRNAGQTAPTRIVTRRFRAVYSRPISHSELETPRCRQLRHPLRKPRTLNPGSSRVANLLPGPVTPKRRIGFNTGHEPEPTN
jgi:hypothetical protein